MRAPFDQIVYAYHGCDRSVGENVLLGRDQLRKSENPYDWLGHGIYFWENAPKKAMDWATLCRDDPRYSRGDIKEPYVLGAVIQLSNCWNLLDKENHRLIQKAHARFLTVLEEFEAHPIRNDNGLRRLDCAVINFAREVWQEETGNKEPFDAVRAAFIEGDALYDTSGFYSDTHIQICVRNTACIKGWFRPTGF